VASVVFPTPPFWLSRARIIAWPLLLEVQRLRRAGRHLSTEKARSHYQLDESG